MGVVLVCGKIAQASVVYWLLARPSCQERSLHTFFRHKFAYSANDLTKRWAGYFTLLLTSFPSREEGAHKLLITKCTSAKQALHRLVTVPARSTNETVGPIQKR